MVAAYDRLIGLELHHVGMDGCMPERPVVAKWRAVLPGIEANREACARCLPMRTGFRSRRRPLPPSSICGCSCGQRSRRRAPPLRGSTHAYRRALFWRLVGNVSSERDVLARRRAPQPLGVLGAQRPGRGASPPPRLPPEAVVPEFLTKRLPPVYGETRASMYWFVPPVSGKACPAIVFGPSKGTDSWLPFAFSFQQAISKWVMFM